MLAAAGDIACSPTAPADAAHCHHRQTSDEILAAAPTAVAALGDNQYESGSLAEYTEAFEPTWGRLRPLTFPVAGNHEYHTASASGYFDYFNGVGSATGRAGVRGQGFYSYEIGQWHVVALNSNCTGDDPASCASARHGAISPAQVAWLRADLASHLRRCTLAYWHAPLFSSGDVGGSPAVRPAWDVLQDYGADMALGGHDHDYERFAPQSAAGVASPSGIREFVVGTGGEDLFPFPGTFQPNSERYTNSAFGALFLSLDADRYGWNFKRDDGAVVDGGAAKCNPTAPVVTNAVKATARAALSGSRIRTLVARRGFTVRFAAPAVGTLRISITDKRSRRVLGSARTTFARTGSRSVAVRLSAAGRRSLSSVRRTTVVATVAFASSGGVQGQAVRTVSLRR